MENSKANNTAEKLETKISKYAAINELDPLGIEDDSDTELKTQIPETPKLANTSNIPGFLGGIYLAIKAITKFFFKLIQWGIANFTSYLFRHPMHALSSLALLLILGLVLWTGAQIHDQMILSQVSDETVNKIITASKYTRDYNSENLASVGTQEFQRVGGPDWAQREGIRAILYHSRKNGLSIEDQAVLLATAEVESGFNPMAKAPTTSACGLFQFIKKTGQLMGLQPNHCMNPWLNAQAGIAHYLTNYSQHVQPLVDRLSGPERVFRTFEVSYYIHHDGVLSPSPSKDVKATILSGTQFLFQTYKILQNEGESKQQAPTFAERFAENFWKVLDNVLNYLSSPSTPFHGKMGKRLNKANITIS